MKGLVLAGGAGSRLRPLTYTGAKQLVPVANRPILYFVIDNLVDAGIRDIGLVISPETGAEVKASVGDGSRWKAKITYLLQDRPAGLAHAVKIAQGFLGDDDFCMFLGDNLIGTRVASMVQRFAGEHSCEASIMLKEVENPSQFGVAEVDASGKVIGLAEKPAHPKSKLALVGIYLFRSSIFRAIAQIGPSARGELEITDAIGKLLELGLQVQFARVDSWWIDTGKKDDLLLANDTVLDYWLEPAMLGTLDSETKITGRVRIEAGAELVRTQVRGPAIIGAGAQLMDARIGPFTSIGDQVVVVRSGIDHSVVMEGTRITDIARIEDSLIGRRVVVHPGSSRRGAVGLLVGDDCRIELASAS